MERDSLVVNAEVAEIEELKNRVSALEKKVAALSEQAIPRERLESILKKGRAFQVKPWRVPRTSSCC